MLAGISVLFVAICAAQKPESYRVRLSPIAMDAAMKVNIAGLGSAVGTLTGSKLVISGTFEDLLSPAIKADIRQGTLPGVRGPVIFTLTISSATSGKLSGTFDLTPDQIEGLRKGQFYIQIASEKAPDGNLWGWLLP